MSQLLAGAEVTGVMQHGAWQAMACRKLLASVVHEQCM